MTAEDKLQSMCVRSFRLKYPELALLFFSIPNGANLTDSQRMLFTQTGMVPGVSDSILLVSRHGYGALCVEAKVRKGDIYNIAGVNHIVKRTGTQSPAQHEWELAAISAGNKYELYYTVAEFDAIIDAYLI